MNKVAFLTTIFPMKEDFLTDFFNSLVKQTVDDFDIIVVNDGYNDFDIVCDKYTNLNIIELNHSNTPAKNREFGINYLIDRGYDIAIFGDSDDCFSPNRVEQSVQLLDKVDIVVNDLTLFDAQGIISKQYLSQRLSNHSEISFNFIKEKNVFGLSNTALNLKQVSRVSFPEHLIAVDWHFFSCLLASGLHAMFSNEIITYYRQHGNNTIGLGTLTKALIEKGVDVKINHYQLMQARFQGFEVLLKESIAVKALLKDVDFVRRINKRKQDAPLWWEDIQEC